MSAAQVSTVFSRAPVGLQAPRVRVEVHLCPGLPAFGLVGLPETVVRESKERVRSALTTSGFQFPQRRITVNLSPADLPKEGGRFDLPIAVGILAASGQIPMTCLQGREFYGELSLSGELRETSKLLPALVAGSREPAELIVPAANALEAGHVPGARLMLAHHLAEVCDTLQGRCARREAVPSQSLEASAVQDFADLADVRGQFAAKRALEVAAAGGHGMIMMGPPGAGKTLLAQRLPGLLGPMTPDEALEVATLESAAGRRPSFTSRRPFRSPHHTASAAALIGGGVHLRPGEISLAHWGVLFLDELPEYSRNALEALREPLESGVVLLSRAKRSCEYPARFQLIAAMNPCPCGYAGDRSSRCRCSPQQIHRYRNRVSGPLLDRIDIHVELGALEPRDLMGEALPSHEPSAAVAERVAAAQSRQLLRQGKLNARLSQAETERVCELEAGSKQLLETAFARLGLSARGYHRILRLARTCADLAGRTQVGRDQISEAVALRTLERTTC